MNPTDRSWDTQDAGIAALALVLAISVTLATVVFAPGAYEVRLGNSATRGPPLNFRVTLGSWVGTNVNVTLSCTACQTNVSAGALFNLTLHVSPECAKFGCSSQVNRTSVDAPFVLVTSAPVTPVPLPSTGVEVVLTIRAPATGGATYLNGSVLASPPPGPVVITGQDWAALNQTGGTGGLRIAPVLAEPIVRAGSEFNETLQVNNSLEPFEDVLNVSVAPPFTLLGKGSNFPLELNINQTGILDLQLLAPPTPGGYRLNGTVFDRTHPYTVVASINVSFVGVAANLTVASLAGIPRDGLGGADLNGSLVLQNPTSAPHRLAYNRTTGPWFFLNGTPNGSFVIGAGLSFRYYFTLYVEQPAGSYPLGIVFTILSEPRCRGRGLTGAGGPPGPIGPGSRRSSPTTPRGRGPGPRRTPG